MNKKELALTAVRDSVTDYFYYNRDNTDFTTGDLSIMLINGILTKEEIIEEFTKQINAMVIELITN